MTGETEAPLAQVKWKRISIDLTRTKTMRKFFYLAMASVAAIFAGCSNDEDALQTTDSLKDKPINVDVMVSGIHTRAGYDNTTSLPTQFYLSIDQDDTKYDYNNVVMKYEEGKWVAYESADENAAKKQLLWENYLMGINS